MWKTFSQENADYNINDVPDSFYFCDNQKDADECAELVVRRIKQATAGALRTYEVENERLPKVSDLFIITDWDGQARAIIRTTKVEEVAYNKVSAEFAETEGEGDKSIEYWRRVHWDFFTREMKEYGEEPTENMIILCEYFETIWTESNE